MWRVQERDAARAQKRPGSSVEERVPSLSSAVRAACRPGPGWWYNNRYKLTLPNPLSLSHPLSLRVATPLSDPLPCPTVVLARVLAPPDLNQGRSRARCARGEAQFSYLPVGPICRSPPSTLLLARILVQEQKIILALRALSGLVPLQRTLVGRTLPDPQPRGACSTTPPQAVLHSISPGRG